MDNAIEQTSPIFRPIRMTSQAKNTIHPLYAYKLNISTLPTEKKLIKLCLGDPTVDGNIVCPENVARAIADVALTNSYNGYVPVCGCDETRKVVAEYMRHFCSTEERKSSVRWDQVIITSGVSHAINLSLCAICNPGDNILIGMPTFSHYKTVCDSYGIECRYYPLNADNNWECDLETAAKLVDSKTRCFVIVNPSNPCGSNFSRVHVEEIVRFCEHYQLPLISDEIYAELVFSGETFTSAADIDTPVPRLILNGTAKFQANPGWRIAWATLIDTKNVAVELFEGMSNLAYITMGANSVGQIATAKSLLKIPRKHLDDVNKVLASGANVYERLRKSDIGLSYVKPRASMFVMVRIDFSHFKDIHSDTQFCDMLLEEEKVKVLPSILFGMPGFFRATISRPVNIIEEAVDRIVAFCKKHACENN